MDHRLVKQLSERSKHHFSNKSKSHRAVYSKNGYPAGLSPVIHFHLYYNADLLEICDRPGKHTSAIGFVDDANILHMEKAPRKTAKL